MAMIPYVNETQVVQGSSVTAKLCGKLKFIYPKVFMESCASPYIMLQVLNSMVSFLDAHL